MTPDDLTTVGRSWSALRDRRAPLLSALVACYDEAAGGGPAAQNRAEWLVDAVDRLVPLLAAPSRLAEVARSIGSTWPDRLTAPSFCKDGRAWMTAASRCAVDWSERTEWAWRQAWLLLSDVLAAETLSPFSD